MFRFAVAANVRCVCAAAGTHAHTRALTRTCARARARARLCAHAWRVSGAGTQCGAGGRHGGELSLGQMYVKYEGSATIFAWVGVWTLHILRVINLVN
jgi:hypothetical protein